MTEQQQQHLQPPQSVRGRLLEELNRPDAHTSGDPHFIVMIMNSIIQTLSAPDRNDDDRFSKGEFAVAVFRSCRFYQLFSAHVGGELDGWGAGSALVFTSLHALMLLLTTTMTTTSRSKSPSSSSSSPPTCAAAWALLSDCQLGTKKSKTPCNNKQQTSCHGAAGAGAAALLARLVTFASSCPSALVQEMTNPKSPVDPPNLQGDNTNKTSNTNNSGTFYSLQTEGEITSWFASWECLAALVTACGPVARVLCQSVSEDIGRHQALRQSAAVFVAYMKKVHSSAELTSSHHHHRHQAQQASAAKLVLGVAKEFVEKSFK